MASPNVKMGPNGFPSDQVPPLDKGKEWCLRYSKAFHNEYSAGNGSLFRYSLEDYGRYRSYANGCQPIDQYKKMLSTRSRRGKKDMSWRNLDWNILPIVPTLVQVVVNKVLGQKKDIIIQAIDQTSQNEQRDRRNKMLTYISNLELMKRAQEDFGVESDSPFEPGTPMPRTLQEVDMHMQMYPKDRYVMELYDQIDRVRALNNDKQMWVDVVNDLVQVDVGGTKSWIDMTGIVRTRRVIPERLVTNQCVMPDFSDLTRVGEYIEMSISELRSSVPRGTFTEDEYAKMASISSGTAYNTVGIDTYWRQNYRYPYDNEKIMVLDWEAFSADDYAWVIEQTRDGNMNLVSKQNPYWLDNVKWKDERGRELRGVTDQQFTEHNEKMGIYKQVERDSINNLYGGKWVVGTEYIFDYGRKTNVQRAVNRLGDVKSNYNLYSVGGKYMRKAEPIADDVQTNWLQYQNMKAQAKPNGLKINKRALTSLSVAGKGGSPETLDELDLLQMYAETGNIVYKGEDAAGRPYPYDPIQELKGGVNEAAGQYLEFIRNDIDMLRIIFGLNEATDSSTPNPKLGKAIAEMLEQNTNTALGTIYHAYSHLFEETIKSIATLIPDAEMIKSPAKDEGLGASSGDFFRWNSDVTFREMGIKIEDGPTNEVRTTLREYVKLCLDRQTINPEDAYLVENEPNIMRAYWMLSMKVRQKKQDDQQMQMDLYKAEEEKNINSANAAAEAKMQGDMQLMQMEIQKEQMLAQIKERALAMEITGKMALEKLKTGAQLSEAEMSFVSELQNTLLKTQSQERIAELQAETQRKVAASRPKPTAKKKVA